MALIASINSVSVTPTHIKPGDSITIECNLTAGTRKLTAFSCSLYAVFDDVNYLACPIVSKNVNIAANATTTVTFTTTASASDATVDGRITAFAAGVSNSVHDVPLFFGFREVESIISSGGSIDSQVETASTGQFFYQFSANAGAFGKHYNPTIQDLSVIRARYDSENNKFYEDDEGERALVTCKLHMLDLSDGQCFPCTLSWGTNVALICANRSGSIHNRNTGLWTYGNYKLNTDGISRDINPLFNFTFDTGLEYEMTCTYGDDYESNTVVFTLSPAFANLNLSGCGKGAAFGKFSASTEQNPLFECVYPAVFSDNIIVPENKLLKVVTVSDSGSMSTSTTTMTKTINVDSTVIGDGWTAIGVVGHRASNSNCVIYRATIDGTNATLACRYNGTSSGTTITLYANVLCLHTSNS